MRYIKVVLFCVWWMCLMVSCMLGLFSVVLLLEGNVSDLAPIVPYIKWLLLVDFGAPILWVATSWLEYVLKGEKR